MSYNIHKILNVLQDAIESTQHMIESGESPTSILINITFPKHCLFVTEGSQEEVLRYLCVSLTHEGSIPINDTIKFAEKLIVIGKCAKERIEEKNEQ